MACIASLCASLFRLNLLRFLSSDTIRQAML
jgi:hypothetical protein